MNIVPRYLSVCSGIEAATCAWHPLGWTPVAFAEIEKFPSAVLAHHYPSVPNWGDMTQFQEWPDATIDLLVGGTPCQSFSVAGLRQGLADPRGNLALTYLALADKYRPEWLVWENVPGVLSSGGGRDFGAFLGGLGELGYGWAYRVLDAQYFGLAQRRKRVFLVANLRSWQRAAAVLFDAASLRGDSAPRREAGENATYNTAPSLTLDQASQHAVAFDARQSDVIQYGEKTGPLDTDGHSVGVHHAMQVRRLTPRECERLQGFPDDYTLTRYRGKAAADGPRYKALGNSMAVPVMRWIGQRLQRVSEVTT